MIRMSYVLKQIFYSRSFPHPPHTRDNGHLPFGKMTQKIFIEVSLKHVDFKLFSNYYITKVDYLIKYLQKSPIYLSIELKPNLPSFGLNFRKPGKIVVEKQWQK